MRIAIFGAGAIGGYLGVRLAQAGVDVTVLARGEHLAAMQANGITLHSAGKTHVARPRCVASAAQAGAQDYVFVTLKAHALGPAARDIAGMLGPNGALIPAINGIPYWYFHADDGPHAGRIVESVDPGGGLLASLPPARVIGCVVYPSAEVIAPGVVNHLFGDRFLLGEPDGSVSLRITALSQALVGAGLQAPIRPRIRDDIWVKLWGNMAFNPLSVLTGATLDRLVGQPGLRALVRSLMLEGRAVAEALGCRATVDIDQRLEGAAEVGAHKTSMLQDLERGRPMEVEAILGAAVELGQVAGVATPIASLVLAMLRERAYQAGRA